jgi:hypothetical protein
LCAEEDKENGESYSRKRKVVAPKEPKQKKSKKDEQTPKTKKSDPGSAGNPIAVGEDNAKERGTGREKLPSQKKPTKEVKNENQKTISNYFLPITKDTPS